jgi:cobalamin biosynthesis protein CobT
MCKNNNIRFCSLPPNSTDKLQPLDVGIFGPLKSAWKDELEHHKLSQQEAGPLSKKHFPALLNKVLKKAELDTHLPAAFKKCGLYPVSREMATARIPHRRMSVETEGMQKIMDSVLGKRLEALRGVSKATRGRKGQLGKKIQVKPGECYTQTVDSSEEEEEEEDDLLAEMEVEDEESGDSDLDREEILPVSRRRIRTSSSSEENFRQAIDEFY